MTARHHVFTYNNGIVETSTGFGTDGNLKNVADWGTNRFGVAFDNFITIPRVYKQSCDFQLTQGQDSITRSDNVTTILTYDLTSTGVQATSCPNGTDPYFYAKLIWEYANKGVSETSAYIYPY